MKPLRAPNQQAIGLVEVLVAMGIFLVGITAIVRIFPAGLGTVESTNNRTMASKAAESLLTQYEPILDRLGAIEFRNSGNDIHPDSTPDDPDPVGPPSLNALDDAKQVRGEKHVVLGGGKIALNFAPIVGTGNVPRVYREEKLSATAAAGWGSRDISLSGASTGDKLLISYAWRDDASGNTYYYENYPVTYTGVNPLLPGPSGAGILVPASLKVVRQTTVSYSSPLTNDDANGGVLTLSGVSPGDEVGVDYEVEDWRWINEELTLDAGATAHLLVPFVDPTRAVYLVDPTNPGTVETLGTGSSSRNDDAGTVTSSLFSAGNKVKVIYRTLDEWAVQVYRGEFVYAPASTANINTSAPPQREFADYNWWTAGGGSGGNNTTLGFRKSSAGRGVIVDYNYLDTSVTPNVLRTVRGEFHRIPDSPAPNPVFDPNASSTPADLTFAYEIELNHSYDEIVRVRGVTARARVYWNADGTWRTVQAERVAPLRTG